MPRPALAARYAPLLVALLTASYARSGSTAAGSETVAQGGSPIVGPPHGSVLVVGGGALGPEVYAKFIQLAGGPDALIVDVPTAGGDSVYPPDWSGGNGFKAAGAKHVIVLHTKDRKVADADSFVAPLKHAGGVWFEGGRQYFLVDAYGGTKTETEFHNVLARGGVAGGSSAGASILASFLLRGAPSSDNNIMIYPGYTKGFGFLTGVGIDQHVVARERLADIADSVMPRHPELLGMSEDEGTAWAVQGDVAEIIGRDKAFVYGGNDPTDSGKPFLTLHPGDTYNLGTRHIVHRAAEDSPVSERFVDSLFSGLAAGRQATILVAAKGEVFIDKSYGIPPQARYMPTTTVPNFPLGEMSDAFNGLTAALLIHDGRISLDTTLGPAGGPTIRQYFANTDAVPNGGKRFVDMIGRLPAPASAGRGGRAGGAGRGGAGGRGGAPRPGAAYTTVITRIYTAVGHHKTAADTLGQVQSNVDELYRLELGLESPTTFLPDTARQGVVDYTLGWHADSYKGVQRLSDFGTSAGQRNAFVRLPDRQASIIILTNSDDADARGIAQRITDRLLASKR